MQSRTVLVALKPVGSGISLQAVTLMIDEDAPIGQVQQSNKLKCNLTFYICEIVKGSELFIGEK